MNENQKITDVEIYKLQETARSDTDERCNVTKEQMRHAEEFLCSLHAGDRIDRLMGEMVSNNMAHHARQASLLSRIVPGRIYRWLIRKLFVPYTVPYYQSAMLNYHNLMRDAYNDLYHIAELRNDQLKNEISELRTELNEIKKQNGSE